MGFFSSSLSKSTISNSLNTTGLSSKGAASIANGQLPGNAMDKLKVANSGGYTKNAYGMIIPSYLANQSTKSPGSSNTPSVGMNLPKLPKTGSEWGQHGFIPPTPAEMAAQQAGKTVSDAGKSVVNMFKGAKTMLGKWF